MNSLARVLDWFIERIEQSSALDPIADRLAAVVRPVLPDGPLRDVASGTPMGHPLHPVLVAAPIGSWLGASYLDLAADTSCRDSARRLVGLGVLTALPAATTGVSDWLDTDRAERRVGLAHWALNYTAVSLYAGSWLARRRGHDATGVGLALGGAALLVAAGWLGGHLAYAMGVGVDTTAFLHLASEWTDVIAAADLPRGLPVRASAEGVAIVLLRSADGVVALAGRCTHRGAPLDEGTLEDDCLVCPWHGSTFDVHDGSVRRGPATRPQPTFEVRERTGRIEIRRPDEQRSLRTNPVGA
jgi:nitrite reductase/ring-hydroxylating ferredoxin subunit/uncharacterized membrane protein